jgi:hypothetical protein
MFSQRPARYRSKTTGQYVSEDFARDHPDETYSVNRNASTPLVFAVGIGLLGLALAAGLAYRARR